MPFAALRLKSASATCTAPLARSRVRSISAASRAIGCEPNSSTLTLPVCACELTRNNRSKATRYKLGAVCLFATATMIEFVNFSLYFRWKTDPVQLVRMLQSLHHIAHFADLFDLR